MRKRAKTVRYLKNGCKHRKISIRADKYWGPEAELKNDLDDVVAEGKKQLASPLHLPKPSQQGNIATKRSLCYQDHRAVTLYS